MKKSADPGLRLVAGVFLSGLAFLTAWTIGVHVATLAALPFVVLYPLFIAALAIAAVSCRIDAALVFAAPHLRLPCVKFDANSVAALTRSRNMLVVALPGAFLATAAIQYRTSNFTPLWLTLLATAGAALFASRKCAGRSLLIVETKTQSASSPISPFWLFVVAAAAMTAFYFLTSVPDADDSLFVNLAAGARRAREALYANDTMLGVDGLALIKSTYKLESYQLLAALIADATGLPTIVAAHSVIPLFACLWAASILVLVHHALFRENAAASLAIHLLLLIALDGTLQSYGYHAVPRFFQGKGPFVTAMIPLIAVLTFDTLKGGRRSSLLLLVAAIVASLGLTANAIYAGPLAAALVAFPFLFGAAEGRRRTLRLAAIFAYPALIAGYLLAFDPPGPSENADPGAVGEALWAAFGSPYALALMLSISFAAAGAGAADARLRPVSIYMIGILMVVANPFLWDLFGKAVTGNVNYRLFWATPAPLALSIVLGLAWSTRARAARALIIVALAGAVIAPGSILHKTAFGPVALKVPREDYAIAKAVAAAAAPSDLILAPEEIAAWIPSIDGDHPVIEARAIYAPQRKGQLLDEAFDARTFLFGYWRAGSVEREETAKAAALIEALNVSIVVADSRRPHHLAVAERLAASGFEAAGDLGPYRLLRRR